jgi:capsular polysaccharide biosynthesis protein
MESAGLLTALRRHLAIVLALTLLGLALGGVVTAVLPRTYEAKATLFLRVQAASTSLYERSQFALQRVQSYPELLDSPGLLRDVISTLRLNTTPQELSQRVTADNPTSTVLLNVTASAPTPDGAAAIANAAADELAKNVNALENNETTSKNAVMLVPQISAQPPAAPSSPNRAVILGLGLIAGFVVGALLALLLERVRPRVRTIADVRRVTGLPVIAQFPRGERVAEAAAAAAAVNLRTITHGHIPPLLLLAPAETRAARTGAQLETAWGLAQSGRRAVAITAPGDPAAPRGADLAPAAPGLSDVLSGRRNVEDVTVAVEDRGFEVLPVGDLSIAPSTFELERSAQQMLAPLVTARDVVVLQADLNSRPLDLATAGRLARTALLVVSRRTTTEHDLRRVLSQVRVLDILPIGVLMTDVSAPSLDLIETWTDSDFLRIEFEAPVQQQVAGQHEAIEAGTAAHDR